MNAHTKLSSKGQIVIPKEIRDELGLRPGAELEVTRQGSTIVMHTVTREELPISWEQFVARKSPYLGRRMTDEEISSVPDDTLREHYAQFPI